VELLLLHFLLVLGHQPFVGRKFRIGGKVFKYLGEDRELLERERLLILLSDYNF
jgi:hypothetical protein